MKKIINLRLIYKQYSTIKLLKNLQLYNLVGYTNSNFASDPKNWKLVMRYYFFFNEIVVLWSGKKLQTIFIFTNKLEYIVLNYKIKEIMWIRKFVNKLEIEVNKKMILYKAKKINIILIKNAESQ